MNDNWDKERSLQCALDRKLLADVHLVLCGDEHLGIVGLKDLVPALREDVDALLLAKANTMSVGKAATIVGSLFVGIAAVATAVIVVAEFIHNLFSKGA